MQIINAFMNRRRKNAFEIREFIGSLKIMDSYYRFFPAEGQIDPSACWAACLRWWMYATKSILKNQQDILSLYDCEDDGTISKKVILQIMNDPQWGMTMEKPVAAGGFTASKLKKLLAHGPVYVGFTETSTRKKHVNIIYDMEIVNDKARVAVMEPQAVEKADYTYDGEHQIKSLREFSIFGTVYAGSLRPQG